MKGSLSAFPAEQTVGNDLKDRRTQGKDHYGNAQSGQNFYKSQIFPAMPGAAQNVVRPGLIFTAKNRRRYHNAQKHHRKQEKAFVFRHVRAVSRIKIKGHFHFFIHFRRDFLRRRIILLFQLHQIGKMGTTALIKSKRVLLRYLLIVRGQTALGIRHHLMQSRNQFGIRQNFAVPDILRKISVKITI
jgi:hypothetical protein